LCSAAIIAKHQLTPLPSADTGRRKACCTTLNVDESDCCEIIMKLKEKGIISTSGTRARSARSLTWPRSRCVEIVAIVLIAEGEINSGSV